MHEMPVTQGLLKTALAAAAEQKAKKIRTITLKMGDNCDYVPEIIQEYFNILSENTIADGAKIMANYVHTTVICRDCEKEFTRHEFKDRCPYCGSMKLRLNAFTDFYIESMEVDES